MAILNNSTVPKRRVVYTKETLYQLSVKPHQLDSSAAAIVKDLGIERMEKYFKRTHRGCRSGCRKHKTNESVTSSHYVDKTSTFKYGLLNTRSIRNKAESVYDLVLDKDFDCLAITETWLSSSDQESDIVKSFTPAGYSFIHCARPQYKTGGRVGFLYKSSLNVKEIINRKNINTFEYQEFQLKLSASSVSIIVLYRPPSSAGNGFTFTSFMG